MTITVFTPAYNRGYIIENLYRSLQRQTFRDFEWVVIDDGSTDNTEELFSAWTKEENFFPITYQKVENGGKHRAINRGVQMAKGELFFIVDSDDYLTDDALERVIAVEQSIPTEEKRHFAGVCGKKGYSDSMDVGSTFVGEYLDITSLEQKKNGISGDKAEAFFTDILKKYPFPTFKGENFITEDIAWDRIAIDGYKLRYFNDIIYICDYLPDGLTTQGNAIFEKNPKGWSSYIVQSVCFGKLRGRQKWFRRFEYYRARKGRFSAAEIARELSCNPLLFPLVMLPISLYYDLRWGRKQKP